MSGIFRKILTFKRKDKKILRKPSLLSASAEKVSVENFTEETSIHGIRFLSKSKHGKFTQFFWGFSLVLSLIGLAFNTKDLYTKLKYAPDIGLTESFELSQEIPYPAITICSPVFAKNGLANLSRYMGSSQEQKESTSKSERSLMAANFQRCGILRVKHMIECCTKDVNENVLQLIEQSSATVDEFFESCRLQFKKEECSQMMARTVTDRGVCYTTNLQDLKTIFKDDSNQVSHSNWSLDEGYTAGAGKPVRLTKKNVHIFRIKSTFEDTKNVCMFRDIIIKFHMPNEIPTIFHRNYMLEYGHEMQMFITARVTKAHPSLAKYSPDARKCYFQGEKDLEYFKIYTKSHCQLECLTSFILTKCGCVAFYMPKNSSMKICEINEMKCLMDSTFGWPEDSEDFKGNAPCDCYPTCNDIEYSAHEVKSKYDAKLYADFIANYSTNLTYSNLYLQFDNHVVEVKEKFVEYTAQQFIADLGGLLGLFLGCSLLSIIEIFFLLFKMLRKMYSMKFERQNNRVDDTLPFNDEIFKELEEIDRNVFILRQPLYKREETRTRISKF